MIAKTTTTPDGSISSPGPALLEGALPVPLHWHGAQCKEQGHMSTVLTHKTRQAE
jgi:hypothetical protein